MEGSEIANPVTRYFVHVHTAQATLHALSSSTKSSTQRQEATLSPEELGTMCKSNLRGAANKGYMVGGLR